MLPESGIALRSKSSTARSRASAGLPCKPWGEFYVAATRKGIMPSVDAAAQAADWLELFPTVAASAAAIRAALADSATGRVSYWDALLVATAAEAGCRIVLTEDMSDGSALGGLRIHNPFAASAG